MVVGRGRSPVHWSLRRLTITERSGAVNICSRAVIEHDFHMLCNFHLCISMWMGCVLNVCPAYISLLLAGRSVG